jgi:cobalt-precorrin 5A hydrolase
MVSPKLDKLAVWALTPNGVKLAHRLADALPDMDIYVPNTLAEGKSRHIRFEKLSAALAEKFRRYSGHIFIMSTGIVVRVLAPLIQTKTQDPAVVVTDDLGINAISLLSGHIGGANALTCKIAGIIKANPVITTATDINGIPAIDLLAIKNDLVIENPAAIKTVNMALLKNETIGLHDPFNCLTNSLMKPQSDRYKKFKYNIKNNTQKFDINNNPCIFVDDARYELPSRTLILRPPTLVAGIGCNRGTDARDIRIHLGDVLESHGLSPNSIKCLASIDVKNDEAGLIAVSESIGRPLVFFTREELNQVTGIQNPSSVVEKHLGVKSVCEAAAILASRNGTLIVPKQSTQSVTVAIARINFMWSESGRATRST